MILRGICKIDFKPDPIKFVLLMEGMMFGYWVARWDRDLKRFGFDYKSLECQLPNL
jgi:hypothetical protein